jgi:phosphotransferase system  glucose/maltose/N-acetylglucosamine-specific IIC component
MKIVGYVIHALALILIGLGAAVSWTIFFPLAILLEVIYFGLFYFLIERTKEDSGM